MRTIYKEINNLYFINITSNYVVVNDEYHGLIVMDFDLNIKEHIYIGDIVINHSIKNNDKLLLFNYEDEYACYVDIVNHNVLKINLDKYQNVYFSNIYFWIENKVYLFAQNDKRIFIVDLELATLDELLENKQIIQDKYFEFYEKNVQAYNHDKKSALILLDSSYCIFNQFNNDITNMNINYLKQNINEIPSNQVYVLTDFSSSTIINVSEIKIMIRTKNKKELFILPPYDSYRFIGGILNVDDKSESIFAICDDISSKGNSLVMKYNI